jgi:hypothetical protein
VSGRVGRRVGAALVGVWLLSAGPAGADGWGGIRPGQTTAREVEARYGRPTRERAVTEGGRTGAEWTYMGERAPKGLDRMVVGLGLLGSDGFRADVVRGLTLYPKPQVFTVEMIVAGWGAPDGIGTDQQTGRSILRYETKAILVVLDATETWAEIMVFALEKPAAKTPS